MALPELEEVVIRENHISQLPALPETMTLVDASHNNIGSKGIHHEAFKVRTPSILTIIHVIPIRATITFQMSLLQIDCIIHSIEVIENYIRDVRDVVLLYLFLKGLVFSF